MANPTLIGLANELLAWREGAHDVLGDWLEDNGFGRRFHRCGNLHTRVGVCLGLLRIGAIDASELVELELATREVQEVVVRWQVRLEHPMHGSEFADARDLWNRLREIT